MSAKNKAVNPNTDGNRATADSDGRNMDRNETVVGRKDVTADWNGTVADSDGTAVAQNDMVTDSDGTNMDRNGAIANWDGMAADRNGTSVVNLRLKFPGEPELLFEDLSLSIPHGQKVLVLGPSGSGKSTLLQVLCGLIPHSIEIPLKYDDIQMPDSWGFVFQDPDTQFCMSYVDEELAFVLENQQVPRTEMDERMRQALLQVGLDLKERHIPIQHLSQGMKQRLALASILLLRPETVFLDEPSAFLDDEGTEQIWQSVKQTLDDRTVIVVEHKIDAVVDWIDRIIMFDEQGCLIADGVPDFIFQQHKAELVQYGIWYPTVWQEYLEARGQAAAASESGLAPAARASWVGQVEVAGSTAPIGPGVPTERSGPIEQTGPAEQTEQTGPTRSAGRDIIIELERFEAYRGKERKLEVEQAAAQAQSWIAVTGRNGAGKSTLLLALMQLLYTTGKYEVEGKAIPSKLKKRQPPESLALVFQNPEMQFIANSLFDELAYALIRDGKSREETEREVRRLLQWFHLDFNADRHPFQLSMGQKRRLSVAAALVGQTSTLLLDEPTFGQDARNTFHILEQLEQLRLNGKTIMMVTHDRHIVDHFATEEWIIEQGKLIEIRRIRPRS